MPDTWITDIRDFLDAGGRLPENPRARGIVEHLGAIVSALTSSTEGQPRGAFVRCRRRPGRRPCPGRIDANFETGTGYILWQCPVCGDRGLIEHWQRTPWDQGEREALPDIRRVTYRRGLLEWSDQSAGCGRVVLEGELIPREVVVAIHDNDLLGLEGTYGDPRAGDPAECDELVIEHAVGRTAIVLYNRAIMLFTTDDEIYRRIHRVCCVIDNALGFS